MNGGAREELQSWLDAHGIELDARLYIDEKDGQRGIFAHPQTFISADTVIATIPVSSILSAKTSTLSRYFDHVHHDPVIELSVHLGLEIAKRGSSRWSEYISSLPRNEDILLASRWRDKSWLKGTELGRMLLDKTDTEAALRHIYDTQIEPDIRDYLDFAAVRHAYALVSSRAFVVDAYHGLAMCPLADVCVSSHRWSDARRFNHSVSPHVSMQADDVCPECGSVDECPHDGLGAAPSKRSEGLIEMITLRAIEADDEPVEVFNTYGDLSNALLLRRYGFSCDANPYDVVRWPTSRDVAAALKHSWSVEDESRWREIVRSSNHLTESSFVTTDTSLEQPSSISLHIDADAALSKPLFTLCLILSDDTADEHTALELSDALTTIDELEDSEDVHSASMPKKRLIKLAHTVITVMRARLATMHRPELGVDDLFALQEDSDKATKLAIGHAIDTRLLLEACIQSWLDLIETCTL